MGYTYIKRPGRNKAVVMALQRKNRLFETRAAYADREVLWAFAQ